MVEVSWDEAYPKNMLPVDNESDKWTHSEDINSVHDNTDNKHIEPIEVPYILSDTEEIHIENPVLPTNAEVITEQPVVEDLTTDEIDVEEQPVVKKKNTRRTKKK